MEFIGNNVSEPYLEYLNYDNLFYLDLIRFQNSLMSQKLDISDETGHKCHQDILKSLGLRGFPNPLTKEKELD